MRPSVNRLLLAPCRFVPASLRFGAGFRSWTHFLDRSAGWNRAQLDQYRLEQLQLLLRNAEATTTYYAEAFADAGVAAANLTSFADLPRFPLLDRDTVRRRAADLISRDYPPSRRSAFSTGGTTGTPLELSRDENQYTATERAFNWRFWRQQGYSWHERCLVLKGQRDLRERIDYNARDRALFVFNPTLDRANLDRLVALFHRHHPAALHGYPSMLAQFARLLLERPGRVEFPSLKLILPSSEQLLASNRLLIETAFRRPVIDLYGQNERAARLEYCQTSGLYHIIPEYGHVEMLAPGGAPATRDGEVAELVGTGFHNAAMPLVRYRTGDYVIVGPDSCPCGRPYQTVRNILGRTGDFIVTPSGRRVSATVLEFDFDLAEHVADLQLVQESPGQVRIDVVAEAGFTPEMGDDFRRRVQERLGPDVTVEWRQVPAIARPPNRKRRLVISRVAEAAPPPSTG
jgi:phenylacetate-CoA ligase